LASLLRYAGTTPSLLERATVSWDARNRGAQRALGARERVSIQLMDAEHKAGLLVEEAEVLDLTQQLAIALEGEWRKTFEESLEEVISDGLTLVMEEDHYLHIKSSVKNGASAVSFSIETPRGETGIIEEVGGSVVQITSFLLRLMVTLSHRPELRRVILLDEAFGGMQEEKVPVMARLLRQLVDDTGIQLIFVTQDRQYADVADVVIDVASVGKVTVLKTERDDAT
jgi:hypothetical protein